MYGWSAYYGPHGPLMAVTNSRTLAELKTLDELPSPTPPITGYRCDDVEKVIMVLPVHGLGVLTLTAEGVGLFTSEEIRPATRSEKDI